jgi:DNA-binding GntR family transcriptional regulator
MTGKVAGAIREAILSGEWHLGERILEGELKERFDVSSSVIRVAVHILQGEGLVVADVYRGRSVYSLTESEARDLTVVRTSLESLAAFLAAERLDEGWAGRISAMANRLKAARPASYLEWVDLELGFHRTIWEAAQLDWLCKQLSQLTIRILSLSTQRLFHSEESLQELLEIFVASEDDKSSDGHQLVAHAILSRDPEEARKNMILHLMTKSPLAERRQEVFNI